VRALYGKLALGRALEEDVETRAAVERQSIDDLLFWFARECGADCYKQPGEKLDGDQLQLRADLIPVVMSVSGQIERPTWVEFRDPWLRIWDDALTVPDDWTSRHLNLGGCLRGLRTMELSANRAPQMGDLIRWPHEPDIPWVVISANGRRAVLIEPAAIEGSTKMVLVQSIFVVDPATLAVANASSAA
jgi:hypothetical protein